MRPGPLWLMLSMSGCCVLVVDNGSGGSNGGNPFQTQTSFPDSGLPQPVAVCRAVPVDAGVGEAITFDGSDSSPSPGASVIVAWAWDFGDGATGSGPVATHAYVNAGLFVTTLTVTDDQGLTSQDSCPAVSVQP